MEGGHSVPNDSQFLTNRDVAGELPTAGIIYRRKGQQKSGEKRGRLSVWAGYATSSTLAGPSAFALPPINLRRPSARRCEAHHIWLIFPGRRDGPLTVTLSHGDGSPLAEPANSP